MQSAPLCYSDVEQTAINDTIFFAPVVLFWRNIITLLVARPIKILTLRNCLQHVRAHLPGRPNFSSYELGQICSKPPYFIHRMGKLGVAVESLKSCSLISFHRMVSVRDQKFIIVIFHKLKLLASDKLFIGKKKKKREKNVYLRLWCTAYCKTLLTLKLEVSSPLASKNKAQAQQ